MSTPDHGNGRRPLGNPALREHARQRQQRLEARIADTITAFAGSMVFVYVHIAWFGLWLTIPVEQYPYGLLTMIVSLEAIFLSTFILISQNRADERRQIVADQQWETVQKRNDETDEILRMLRDIHASTAGAQP
jgi:uncharacterized membrane protein